MSQDLNQDVWDLLNKPIKPDFAPLQVAPGEVFRREGYQGSDAIVNPELGPQPVTPRGNWQGWYKPDAKGPGLDQYLAAAGLLSPNGGGIPALGPLGGHGSKPGDGMYRPEAEVQVILPPWTAESFSTNPGQVTFTCSGVVWYATWLTVQTYKVPDDSLYTLQGITIEVPGIAVGEILQIQVYRDMEVICGPFETVKVFADPNPAKQYAFGGSFQELPMNCVFRPGQQLSVRIQLLGPEPISYTDSTPVNTTVITTLIGYQSPLPTPRDGARQQFVGGDYVGR